MGRRDSSLGGCRRRALLAVPVAAWLAGARPAWASGQLEEPLAASVRTALSAAVSYSAPPMPAFASEHSRQEYQRWLQASGQRLAEYRQAPRRREEFLQTVWYEATRAGLPSALVLGVIQVESAFRQYAISVAGARGYMQVMPFWARLIGDGDVSKLFHAQTNLRFGCVILRHYLELEKNDLFMALGRYNGSRGRAAYPNAVLSARERWLA